jgi:hypothetical protein
MSNAMIVRDVLDLGNQLPGWLEFLDNLLGCMPSPFHGEFFTKLGYTTAMIQREIFTGAGHYSEKSAKR